MTEQPAPTQPVEFRRRSLAEQIRYTAEHVTREGPALNLVFDVIADNAAAVETERDRLAATLAAVRELAESWAALAPDDDWGESMSGTVLADAGRTLLAVLDGEPPGDTAGESDT